jgi:type I restriction enzyme, S subunit
MGKSYTLYVHLDYGRSAHAGAGEMFQVFSIKDADGKDYTSLIDQGTHYHSLDDLQKVLAAKLGVSPSEITLFEE